MKLSIIISELVILEEFHPMNHINIATRLDWIGSCWFKTINFNRAIEYFEKCLRIREASLSSKHLSTIDTLSNMDLYKKLNITMNYL